MKRLLILALCCVAGTQVHAQISMELEAEKQGFKNGVHWVKRNWYNPLNGTTEPDESSIPNIYLRPNQLIEYSKEGRLKSVTDFEGGTDDKTASTERYIWKDGRLAQKTRENADYEALYTTTYSYDAEGHETKQETKPGPGDKLGIFGGMATIDESSWNSGRLAASSVRGRDGSIQKRTSYSYDGAGRKTREEYYPAGLYSARTYEYDGKGNLIQDIYLDKDGKPSTVWTYEYNTAGKPTRKVMSHFYQGKKDSEEITTYAYNPQGDLIAQKSTKDGKVTYDYTWKHTYDEKGNRIRTAHIKEGKPEVVEVLKLMYYKP